MLVDLTPMRKKLCLTLVFFGVVGFGLFLIPKTFRRGATSPQARWVLPAVFRDGTRSELRLDFARTDKETAKDIVDFVGSFYQHGPGETSDIQFGASAEFREYSSIHESSVKLTRGFYAFRRVASRNEYQLMKQNLDSGDWEIVEIASDPPVLYQKFAERFLVQARLLAPVTEEAVRQLGWKMGK